MKRWTIAELNHTDDLLFAISILSERRNGLSNINSPLCQKLGQSIKTLENVRDDMQGLQPEGIASTRDNRLAGGYILLSTYATLTDDEAKALRDTDETPEAVIAIREDFLEEWIKPEYVSLEDFLGNYTYDTIEGLMGEALLGGAFAFEYRPDLDDPFIFGHGLDGDVMLAYTDFLSGKLQENGMEEASKYLDCLFSL